MLAPECERGKDFCMMDLWFSTFIFFYWYLLPLASSMHEFKNIIEYFQKKLETGRPTLTKKFGKEVVKKALESGVIEGKTKLKLSSSITSNTDLPEDNKVEFLSVFNYFYYKKRVVFFSSVCLAGSQLHAQEAMILPTK